MHHACTNARIVITVIIIIMHVTLEQYMIHHDRYKVSSSRRFKSTFFPHKQDQNQSNQAILLLCNNLEASIERWVFQRIPRHASFQGDSVIHSQTASLQGIRDGQWRIIQVHTHPII
jgi:hypothetical protein